MLVTPVLTPVRVSKGQVPPAIFAPPQGLGNCDIGALTMIQSKQRRRKGKPEKPRPDFPLFPHATKRWAKKIRGKLHYFGPWDDPEGALAKYLDQKDDLYAGRKPRGTADGFTVRDLCNHFLNSKRIALEAGDLVLRTFDEYKVTCDRIIEAFGKGRLVENLRPEDFELLRSRFVAKGWGPITLMNTIQRVRVVFKYAADNGHIPRPVLYGQGFKRPSLKSMRRARNARGPRMFEADELRKVLGAAPQPLKAMIFLGINCGYGNADCGNLPFSALDLERGWVTFPRPKTEVARRCPLWPETVESLREALARRPEPRVEGPAGLVFMTKQGRPWAKTSMDNPISKETAKLLKALGIQREGLSFYALRHTFETVAGETDRQIAVDYIMGHTPRSDDMSAVYRERISDERLRAVTDYVRGWLFPTLKHTLAAATDVIE
jgi:integrase